MFFNDRFLWVVIVVLGVYIVHSQFVSVSCFVS